MEHVETECPICHENYTEPKILPCAHLLCRNCLVSWVKTGTGAHCPLCRSDIFDQKLTSSKTSEDLADSLPTDHAMSAIVKSCNVLSMRQVCCVHTNTDAVSMCLHCSIMLCQFCVEYHHTLPTTSSHKTENLATLTSERLAACQQTSCSAHPNETSKLFCVTHGVSICHLCASSKHRSCEEVTDLNEILDKHKQSFTEMEDILTKAESSLKEALAKYEELVTKAEAAMKDSYTKVDSTCDDLITSVESCRNQLKKILKESEESFKAAIQERKSYLERRIGLVTSHRLLVKRVQQTSTSSVQVAMVTVIKNRIEDFNSVVSLPPDMKPIKIAKLNIEEASSRVKNELENINHMTVITSVQDHLKNVWMFHENCGTNIELTNNGQTALVRNNEVGDNRLVMSSEPLSTNMLYELLVEETDLQYNGGYIIIGVCEENPLSVTLPSSCHSMKSFVGAQSQTVIDRCKGGYVNSFTAFTALVGSRFGAMVDTSHSLHVYVDGKDQGVVANVTQPCYAMFDFRCFITKVSLNLNGELFPLRQFRARIDRGQVGDCGMDECKIRG